jgi:hypothetical protein
MRAHWLQICRGLLFEDRDQLAYFRKCKIFDFKYWRKFCNIRSGLVKW